MDDVAQDVGVASFGHCFEEIPTDKRAPVGHACVVDEVPSVLDDVRQVEEDAAQVGVAFEDRGEQPSASARNIDYLVHPREVIARGDKLRVGG
jgi:hypothetical protein